MPKIRFTDQFDYQASAVTSLHWPAGWAGEIDDHIAERAIAEGKAEALPDDWTPEAPAA